MTVRLLGRFGSARSAARVAAALSADDPGYVKVRVRGATLDVTIRASSAASARATVDDLLACVRAAERSLAVGSGRPRAPLAR